MTKNTTKTILCMNEEKGITLVSNGDYINALVNGKLYNTFNFRPLGGNGRQLREDSQNAIREMLPAARAELDKLKAAQTPAPAPTANPANPAPAAKTPYDSLLETIMGALADKAAADMATNIYATVEKMVVEKFGMLPQTHRIEIPNKEPVTINGVMHKDFDKVVQMLIRGHGVYLCGAAGTGKSYMAQQIAKALNLEYWYTASVVDDVQLKGFIDANGHYHETQFYKAFTTGGVFLLDELDASNEEVLTILNNALANKHFDFPTGRTEAHPDFKVIAAGNTYGTGADDVYTGRRCLDAASMDRFALINIGYDREIEKGMANGDIALVDFANAFRAAVKKCGTTCLCTYRGIKRLADFAEFMSKEDALRIGLVKGLGADDVEMISRNMTINGVNEWYAALVKLAANLKKEV